MRKLHTRFRALGSPCEFQLYGDSQDQLEEIAARGVEELRRIETKYSRYLADSIVSQINRNSGSGTFVKLDPETDRLFAYAHTAFDQSGGLFDITSGVLRKAWDFESQRLPAEQEIRDLCKLVGWNRVEWRGGEIHLPRHGMEIDFGGFGKEYAADRVALQCREQGVAAGLIDLGGDVCVVGPHPDGSPWQIGIRNPRDPERAMASLPISRGALATSGDYERFMEIDGRRYCHLLDPRTGWPVEGLAAVSVVADQCLVAGTATTIAMLKGRSGARWLAKLGLPHLWVARDQSTGGSLWPRREAARPSATRSLS
jgi:thiamine biosynthesis lipoprotein